VSEQLALDLAPKPLRPTGPGDWLLSFVETRREMRPNLDVWGYHLVRHAAAVAGDALFIRDALQALVDRGVLTKHRYVPHMPQPVLAPTSSIWHFGNEHAGPIWNWIFRVAPDWRERMGLPPSRSWRIRLNGVTHYGDGPVPAYLAKGVRL
jgi:hypothetical protein